MPVLPVWLSDKVFDEKFAKKGFSLLNLRAIIQELRVHFFGISEKWQDPLVKVKGEKNFADVLIQPRNLVVHSVVCSTSPAVLQQVLSFVKIA